MSFMFNLAASELVQTPGEEPDHIVQTTKAVAYECIAASDLPDAVKALVSAQLDLIDDGPDPLVSILAYGSIGEGTHQSVVINVQTYARELDTAHVPDLAAVITIQREPGRDPAGSAVAADPENAVV